MTHDEFLMVANESRRAAFWAKVDKAGDDGCWLWQGKLDRYGYGQQPWQEHHRRYELRVHRTAYMLLVGPIPDGLVIDHLCRVRHCVNPAHLEAVTDKENKRRGRGQPQLNPQRGDATRCKNGHEFTPENTYWRLWKPTGASYRCCRRCLRDRVQRWEQRRRDKAS